MIKVGWARPDSDVPPGVHVDDDPGCDRGADALARRAAADVGHGRDGGPGPYASGRRPTPVTCCRELDAPTLVLHSLGRPDERVRGRRYLATHITGARLVPLDSANHIVLEDEPAWPVFLDEVTAFLAEDVPPTGRRPTGPASASCSRRASSRCSGWPPRARQRRHRRRAHAQPAHRRAPPAEHLRQARRAGSFRAHRSRRGAAHPRLTTR